MDNGESPKGARVRSRSRKSISHIPTSDTIDKENLAAGSADITGSKAQSKAGTKKSRSKSFGPGGLDALRNEAGNGQKSLAVHQYRSILKPINPVTPPKIMPMHKDNRKQSPGEVTETEHQEHPGVQFLTTNASMPKGSDGNHLLNPFDDPVARDAAVRGHAEDRDQARVAVRTEEEQQAAAKEREQQEIAARKDARRKSLANRRVSFAPEATLHTWDVVEMPEDSTTSSASTSATRRASSSSTTATSPYSQPHVPVSSEDASELPSTPAMQVEDAQLSLSPARQRNLYSKKRRRSSGIPPMNFNNPDDFSSSPYSADSANSDDTNGTFLDTEEQGSSSDSDDKDLVEDETITGVDIEDVTTRSHGNSSTGSSGRLDKALQEAARQAGTQGIEYDENGDITMEMADDEITTAFRSGMARCTGAFENVGQSKAIQGLERISPCSTESRKNTGAIAKSNSEHTMEFTQAFGKILRTDSKGSESENDEEELTMDITTAIGGILSKHQEQTHRTSDLSVHHDPNVDVTIAVGAMLPTNPEPVEHGEDETMVMDLTTAIGAILPKQFNDATQCQVQNVAEQESKSIQSPETAVHDTASGQAPQRSNLSKSRVLEHIRSTASDTGSPSLVMTEARKSNNKNAALRPSVIPQTTPRQVTPMKKPMTPTKQSTPRVIKPITPGKTPPQKNVSMRTGSPKKLFASEIKKAAASPTPKISNFDKSQISSNISSSDVLSKTRPRRPSGLGIDKTGIGSPRISALLDARGSIGEDTKPFVPGKLSPAEVRFADPLMLQEANEQERLVAERHESGRRTPQKEANEQDLGMETDATSNLKGMIESLTPQKKTKIKFSGRKSLHVGTAIGILGKRPTELDQIEDEDDRTPKRLRGMEASPVRNIKLPTPPLKVVTDGRTTRSGRVSLGEIAANARPSTPLQHTSPAKSSRITTPKDQPRYTNVSTDATTPVVATLGSSGIKNHLEDIPKSSNEEERVHLQDFLKLTSIRFMELTTTRRRPTLGPNCALESSARTNIVDAADPLLGDTASELETCVIAGTCTLPMLDLYQHSCRELKKYITEGRAIVREIEDETFEDNPPLFREYISASPDMKFVMDNQFKNVKTHSRLLSKAMWYEWRMKLLDGLKEGLMKIKEGMDEDTAIIADQEQLVRAVLTNLVSERDQLDAEARDLQACANFLASCDQKEIGGARSSLIALEEEATAKRKIVEDLQSQSGQRVRDLANVYERRHECIARIHEAEKVKEDSQDWAGTKVTALQVEVAALERDHEWTIVSAADATLTMTYKRTLQLHFTPQSFRHKGGDRSAPYLSVNSPISLTYIADAHEHHAQPLTTELRFFLQIMRAQLQFIEQSAVSIKRILDFVSSSWKKACHIADESRGLAVQYLTTPMISSDETMAIKSRILLRAMKTKVEVQFEVITSCGDGAAEVEVIVKPSAKVVYGEELNVKKMNDLLKQRIGHGKKGKDRDGVHWSNAINELEAHLAARAKKS